MCRRPMGNIASRSSRWLVGIRILLCFIFAVKVWAADPVVDWEKLHAETLAHYQAIVRINTSNPPGNETAVVNYLKEALNREGIPYKIFAQEPSRATDRKSTRLNS